MWIKARTDTCEFDWVFQQCFAKAFAILVEVIDAFGLFEGECIQAGSEMFEVNSVDAFYADGSSFYLAFGVDEFELVSFLESLEINLPCENIHEAVGELRRDVHCLDGF